MYYLSECLLIKDENQYLLEHLEYGARAGIEHVYIYDNMSAESVENFLQKNAPEWLSKCTIIHYAEKPNMYQNIQVNCYRLFCHYYGHETKWCSFTDVDECWTGNLRKACEAAESEGYLSIRIKQIIHGANGHVFESNGTLFDRFGSDVTDFDMQKCVVQTEHIMRQNAHNTYFYFKSEHNVKEVSSDGRTLALHHFYFRSFEEYIKKKIRGQCSTLPVNLALFFKKNKIDINECLKVYKKYGVTLENKDWEK